MKKSFSILLIIFMSLVLVVAGCGQDSKQSSIDKKPKKLRLAAASSTVDSGLLDYLVPEFEKVSDYKVEVLAVGTGQAIQMGEVGEVDVILVNFRVAEDKFIKEKYGINRKDVMYNNFLLIGPEEDPVKIKGEKDITKALAKIADEKAIFISRGDSSGNHSQELKLWKKAHIIPDTNNTWYIETGQGMLDTFSIADEKKAYTLIDRATFLVNKDKYSLIPIVEGDEGMSNYYSVISVNPDKFMHIEIKGANMFSNWLTSQKVQKMIGEFGGKKFGKPLFFPNAVY